jgi:hypothetical protein
MRLMAISVWLSWLRFAIINFLWSAIRLDSARAPAATSRRTSGIAWTGRSRMRGLTMELHPQARRGGPFDCMQANCQRERGLSPRTVKPASQVWCKLSRVVPVIRGAIPGLLRVVREPTASRSDRPCVACPFDFDASLRCIRETLVIDEIRDAMYLYFKGASAAGRGTSFQATQHSALSTSHSSGASAAGRGTSFQEPVTLGDQAPSF